MIKDLARLARKEQHISDQIHAVLHGEEILGVVNVGKVESMTDEARTATVEFHGQRLRFLNWIRRAEEPEIKHQANLLARDAAPAADRIARGRGLDGLPGSVIRAQAFAELIRDHVTFED